jgi:Domain of unknown function (DUF4157)
MSRISKNEYKDHHQSAAGHVSHAKRNPHSQAAGVAVQRSIEERKGQTAPPVQRQDEEEEIQAKFAIQRQDNTQSPSSDTGASGIPKSVQTKMENTLGTNLSDVKVHQNSSKASDVGALAYTQGSDIHVAPGQYNPGSSSGKQLLGHELTHVAQQKEGRVQATGSVGGLALNDSPALEKEADTLGAKAK